MPLPIAQLIGQRFDKLLVVGIAARTRHGTKWVCQCDCGGSAIRLTSDLKGPKQTSCAKCYREYLAQRTAIHGGALGGKTRLFKIWQQIKQRCENPNNPDFKNYGARQIARCAEWSEFAEFRAWALTHGYADDLTIDRVDNDGGYSPANCQWVTRSENTRRKNENDKRKKMIAAMLPELALAAMG